MLRFIQDYGLVWANQIGWGLVASIRIKFRVVRIAGRGFKMTIGVRALCTCQLIAVVVTLPDHNLSVSKYTRAIIQSPITRCERNKAVTFRDDLEQGKQHARSDSSRCALSGSAWYCKYQSEEELLLMPRINF